MKATMPVTVERPEHYVQLDEQGARNYYRARQRKAFLDREIINPFEEALKEQTGYSDKKRPSRKRVKGYKFGDIALAVACTPTTKRPSYEAVFSDLRAYLEELLDVSRGYGIDRHDLWWPGGNSASDNRYVQLSYVKNRISRKQEEVEKEGVKFAIGVENAPESLLGDAQALPVPLNGAAMRLDEGKARLYLGAKELAALYKAIISDFENALVGLTGYGSDNVPDETVHHWESLGEHLFRIPSIPYPSTSYSKIMDRLTKKGKCLKTKGDFVLIGEGVKIPRLRKYDVRKRRFDSIHMEHGPIDTLFISVKGTLEKMEQFRQKETKQKVRQRPVDHYPLV